MGYTHRYRKDRAPTESEWATIEHTTRLLFEMAPKVSHSAGGHFTDWPLREGMMTYEESYSDNEGFWDKPVNVDCDEPNVIQMMYGHPAIIFDGKGDMSYETFILTSKDPDIDDGLAPGLLHCKTGRKPYDLLVCAVLILVNKVAPGFLEISSNGNIDDWEPALRLARTVDREAILPTEIDPEAQCQPEPMTIEEVCFAPSNLRELPPEEWELPIPSQFADSATESGLFF